MIQKVEPSTIDRERRKTMIAVLPVEVATKITYVNPQQINPLKMAKKEWRTPTEPSKEKRKRKRLFFHKIRPYKQIKEERFETMGIRNFCKSEAINNDQQNEDTIIVPDMQDVPNQLE